eukprot:TRINITY_DN5049_c0_g1_i4.p1 TRINITY_DN5049_c0_g1~~TRINITY_DN5049_c0_g1_i4.p1  ORF type:complete len:449 (+),score=76.54 TRINITY_DN5049_c0_g1_i4:77-1423(+)
MYGHALLEVHFEKEGAWPIQELQDVSIQCASHSISMDSTTFESLGNNAFASREAFSGTCQISYVGPVKDLLLKVHTLDARYPLEDTARYAERSYIHALLNPHDTIAINEGYEYHIGLTVHEDLSTELWDKISENEENRAYFEALIRRFHGRWDSRGEPNAKQVAEECDYLISYTSSNSRVNDDLLHRLAAQGIRFCTDRSLGFGMHFRAADSTIQTLSLGKHGFAQPVAPGTWWDEYSGAAMKTRYGILVLNPSAEYYKSQACLKEMQGIPQDRQHIYLQEEDRIVSTTEHWAHVFDNQPSILEAASEGNLDNLRQLLHDHPRAVHVTDERGRTALYCAAEKRHQAAAELLLQAKADVNSQNSAGWRPLHVAAFKGADGIVKMLLQERAELTSQSMFGHTALHWAADSGRLRGNFNAFKLLVDAKADVTIKDSDGLTALETAALDGTF